MAFASVVIPAHNAAASIAAALASLSPESEVIQEILVVDDASSDETAAIAALAGAELGLPVRLIATSGRDAGHTRNVGIEEASAPLIYFLDADDRHCPGGLRRMVEVAMRTPDAGVFIGAHKRFRDGIGQPVTQAGRYRWSRRANAARYLSGKIPAIAMGSALVRRSAIGDVRFPTNLPYDEDTLFWATILLRATATTIKDCVMIYEESTQRRSDRLTTQPVATFSMYRRTLGNLAPLGVDQKTIAAREGLVAMMIAEQLYSGGDYATAAYFAGHARTAPASLLQTLRRYLHTLKLATRRRLAPGREAELISEP